MISEFIYGGMDGVITTVAIVAGIMGANISTKYALVLGLANLCADGFSMGISRYNSLVDIDSSSNRRSIVSGLLTFVSFVSMGSIPLIPFLFVSLSNEATLKYMLMIFSVAAFLTIGLLKGIYSKKWIKSILEVLVIGMIGVCISFYVAQYAKKTLI